MEQAKTLRPELVQNCRVLPDRSSIIPLLPDNIAFVEIGVAFGDFSEPILKSGKVKNFYAIDIFTFHEYPDSWGGEVGRVFGDKTHLQYYNERFRKYIDNGVMSVMSGTSVSMLPKIKDNSVDIAYVDAEHSYESVRDELKILRKKMTRNGIIILNDYTIFDPLRGVPYGVPRAAHEFMEENDWEMIYLALHPQMFCDIAIRKRRKPTIWSRFRKEYSL